MRHSSDGLKQLAYLEILMADQKEQVTDRDVVDTVLNVLVGGRFDLESNFVVKNFDNVRHLLKFTAHISVKLQAEIWSMVSGILRKSRRNLLAFTESNFIQFILLHINDSSPMIGDLLMDMMTVLTGYSITVAELQLLFTKLKAVDNEWPQSAPKLLKVLQQMPTRHGPDEFFSFPGSAQAAIALPPMCPQKWPYALGWSFSTWLCLDPFAGVSVDQEKPFVFCFQTKAGIGYSAHFLGSVLVLSSFKGPGKTFQASINFDFEPRKWHHVCLAYVYNRWKTSLIRCYVNGELVSTLDMSWYVTVSENFDNCYIGAGPRLSSEHSFCGEMSTIYMFNDALTTPTVEALYKLGPAYKGQFIYDNESFASYVTDRERQVLYDGKLTNAIILMYSPVACDTHICLDSTPTGNHTLFMHAPHAMMLGGVKAVITHSLHSALHSLGGIQMLFPLFGQLDCAQEETVEEDRSLCTTLFDMLCDLLENSDTLQQQMMQSRGFLVISHLLEEKASRSALASPQHLTSHTVFCIKRLIKHFNLMPAAKILVRHITDHLLFNPSLWIHADPQVQLMLYEYLATEYIILVPFHTNPLRRVSTILQLMHSIKHYYWVVNPEPLSGIKPKGTVKARPSKNEVIELRGLMLAFIDRVITTSGGILEDELQCLLNFISTVNEPENLFDVLHLAVLFMIHLPSSMVPLFDGKNGLRVVFKLLSSENEAVRIQALKLLGHFLSRSTSRRKAECMDKFNLFSLIGVKLLETSGYLSMNIYNVLFEILVERMAHQIITDVHPKFNGQEITIQNSGILKVVAKALRQSKPCEEAEKVKRIFLEDLICLCESSEDNRRTILQMSVWQDWLFSLAVVYPESTAEQQISATVMDLFRMLLYHAIRLEYGGWRVWVDTLSILHTRVSFEDFTQQMSQAYKDFQARNSSKEVTERAALSSDDVTPKSDAIVSTNMESSVPKFPAFRVPEFRWSHLHQMLVSDLLFSIEEEIRKWRSYVPFVYSGDEQQLIDSVNLPDNSTFVVNTINLVSNLSDVLITAVGGLLPLLSAATTSSGDVDVLEPGYGLSIEKSVSLLQRVLNLADIMIISSGISLYDLEHEKNMTAGTMLRQCLRIVLTMAVRNCLECRYETGSLSPVRTQLSTRNGGDRSGDPIKSLVDGAKFNLQEVEASRIGLTDPMSNLEHLLQESDVTRLRAVLYRDTDDMKQCQWIAMSVIYFVSVLMVSKYRDILEPAVTPEVSDDTPIFPPMAESHPEIPETHELRRSSEATHREGAVGSGTEGSPMSKRSNRSISPYRASDSEDESADPKQQAVAADVHEVHAEPEVEEIMEQGEKADTFQEAEQSLDERNASQTEEPESSSTSNEEVEDPLDKSEDTELGVTQSQNDSVKLPEETLSDCAQTTKEDSVSNQSVEDVTEASACAESLEDSDHPELAQEYTEVSETVKDSSVEAGANSNDDAEADTQETEGDLDASPKHVSSISVTEATPSSVALESSQSIPKPLKLHTNYQELQTNLSERLEQALGTSAPLLREIFLDFSSYLTKALLGTKGQELLSSGMNAIKMGTSAISLVMLLCSQEWQISLQKHAGLAFIELVNEGCLLSHSSRDHMVKVANEAEHILNKLRAEDANKHEAFQILCAQVALETVEEELTCDRLITSARRRDSAIASKLVDKVLNIVNSKFGPWSDDSTSYSKFWKLDAWEDDSRRRRRMVPNPVGSSHPEAALKAALEHGENEDAINQAREEFHAELKLKRQRSETDISIDDESDNANPDFDVIGPVALTTKCHLVSYGLAVAGTLSITKHEVFFEWDEEDEQNKKIGDKVMKYIELHGRWNMQEMRAAFTRRYLLERRAIEIFLINRTSIFFSLPDFDTVKKVIGILPVIGVGGKYGMKPARKHSLATPRQIFKQSNMTQRWQRREISNFDYIMFLNTMAGRSYNDLNQYPVFPWILSNFTSQSIDLSEPSNYRDLSKPIGALNPERRKFFQERYHSWDHEKITPFHYGTHYSTSAFTLNWLIRVEPFSTLFLNFQGDKFDHANRTFSSMGRAWQNCQTDTADVKELIPEHYTLPEMFLNDNKLKFGSRDDGVVVDDVILPPWAKSPEEFVRISREALESEIVSGQIHEWIDLIFGYKQQGPEALKATNIFYYLTYEGSIDLSAIKDPIMKEALEAQIRSFGQTPSQLLTEPHPMRGSQMGLPPNLLTPKMFKPVQTEACMTLKFWSNSPVVHLSVTTYTVKALPSVITILHNKHFAVNPWNNNPLPIPTQSNSTPERPAASTSSPTSEQLMASLPLALDPILANPQVTSQSKRHLGDNFDERVKLTNSNFTATVDNTSIFACGFWDNSFRVYDSSTGRIKQVVYGHFDMVTCICRSEVNSLLDCFLVTGSKDCTCMIWQWLGSEKQRVYSEQLSSTHNPVAQATLTGHTTPITSVVISAELGMVISGSKDGPCLMHSMNGDLLRSVTPPAECTDPHSILINREGYISAIYNSTKICLFSLNGRFLLFRDIQTPIKCVCISRDGRNLVTAGDLGVVSIWRTHDLAHLYSYPRIEGAVHDVALSLDQRYLLAGMSTGCVVVLNVDFTKWHHDYQRAKEPQISIQSTPSHSASSRSADASSDAPRAASNNETFQATSNDNGVAPADPNIDATEAGAASTNQDSPPQN
ncbi:lipopolysaccharide-responsive and beige-like anchor protein [Watersipora subatra]|uniref:lipopolysaccharide-responsive and beige-like anchor protein n=1 Tax=Watersipora subatra TaxID=2589382 RepID=UPI00355C769E